MADMTIGGTSYVPNTAGGSEVDGPRETSSAEAPSTSDARASQPARVTSDGFDKPATDYSTLGGESPFAVLTQSNTAAKGNKASPSPANQAPANGKGPTWATMPPNPNDTTIVCDGKGGVTPQILGLGMGALDSCYVKCAVQHEESHKADALASDPNICQGKPQGVAVGVKGQAPLDATEKKAYDVEINCLKNELLTASSTCKPAIATRLKALQGHRATLGP